MDTMQEQMRREMEAAEDAVEFTPVVDDATQDIIKEYNVTDAAIALLRSKYSGLSIAGVEDKKGYDLVHSARMEIRGYRSDVEKKRKALKEESLEYGRKVDREANRIKTALESIEDPLEAEEKRIDAEKERIKAEKQREKDAELQRRIDALTAVGHPVVVGDLVTMPATTFAMVLQTATEAWNLKEKERLAAEAALALVRAEEERKAKAEAEAKAAAEKAEKERQAAIAAENAKEAVRLAEMREALRKEQEEANARKAALEREELAKKLREEAEARARADQERRDREEKARKEREAQEAAEQQALEERRKKEREAARPDAEKLQGLAESLRGTAWPNMVTDAGKAVLFEAKDMMTRYCDHVFKKAGAIADTKVMP